jgi:hypothetical protein
MDVPAPIRGRADRPASGPGELFVDRSHDHDLYCRLLRAPGDHAAAGSCTAPAGATSAGW